MKYVIDLEHDDFVLMLTMLKEAQDKGIFNWNAAEKVCSHTKVVFD